MNKGGFYVNTLEEDGFSNTEELREKDEMNGHTLPRFGGQAHKSSRSTNEMLHYGTKKVSQLTPEHPHNYNAAISHGSFTG